MRGRSFLLGVVAAGLLGLVAAALVIVSGVVDVAAVGSAGLQDRILGYASTRAIARHAPHETNPVANDPAALRSGSQHYRTLCAACHGAPGVDPQPFAAGLHPAPPDLASPAVQSFTDGMLYETIARGIGSTGMPAFGPGRQPNDIWSIVSYVRHLPALVSAQRQGSAGETPAPAPPGQRVHQVSISNFKFDPPTLEVSVGDVIEWRNTDFAAHTATANDGSFDTGRIDSGEVKRVVAKRRGEFPYFCRYHVSMKGTVVVQ